MNIQFDSESDDVMIGDVRIPLNLLRSVAAPDERAMKRVSYVLRKDGNIITLTEFRIETGPPKDESPLCPKCLLEEHDGFCWTNRRRVRRQKGLA